MRGRIVRALITGALLVLVAWAPSAQAAFPGQNGKIAYTNYGDPYGVWTMNSDGTGQAFLRTGSEPAWSPDGGHLLFTYGADIRRMPADGSSETVLLSAPGDVFPGGYWWHWAAWSPDQTRIVAAFTDGSTSDYFFERLRTKNADGSGTTQPSAYGTRPAWKPDGSEIAYLEDRGNGQTGGIRAFRLNGGGDRSVWGDDPDVSVGRADYSPNGNQLVFSANYPWGSDNEIFVVSAAGGNAIPLTNNTVGDGSPVWSPDGTKIAFISYRNGNSDIYTMNADGSNETRLTNDPAPQTDPSWQPIPYPGYARPKGASPMRLSLVPAYAQCTAPNAQHGSPLASGSCTPPVEQSANVTVGTSMSGFVRYASVAGNLATETDEADLAVRVQITDVREQGTLADYAGEIRPRTIARLTDRTGSPGGPATVSDLGFSLDMQCTPTPAANVGSTCSITTSLDTLIPGAIAEGRRSLLELSQVEVSDGGADGDTATQPNSVFLRQGVFVP